MLYYNQVNPKQPVKHKIYNQDSYDQVVNFDKSKMKPSAAWTMFLRLRNITTVGRLFGDLHASGSTLTPDYIFTRLVANQLQFSQGSGANGLDRVFITIPVNTTNPSSIIITIKKVAGIGAANYFFFINGQLVTKTIGGNTITTDIWSNSRPLTLTGTNLEDGDFRARVNIAKLSIVDYAQSDDEIKQDVVLRTQRATGGVFLLNVDFNKTTGENLTDVSPNNYTITTIGTKNFATL